LITFRYHVVTLVAVFMAIGLGVLFGATFIDQSIVNGLEAAQKGLGARNETLRNRTLDLEHKNEGLVAFSSSARDRIVRDVLKDRPVFVLSFDSTSGDFKDATSQTLGVAGAEITGSVTLSDVLRLPDDDSRRKLGVALGSTSGQADTLSNLLVTQLVEELQGKNQGLIQKLLDNGLASGQLTPPPGPATGAPTLAPVVIVLAGQTPKDLNDQLVFPLVQGLADAGLVCTVAETGTAEKILRPIRDKQEKVVTVDGAESAVGQTALVLGTQAAFEGKFASYGTGKGATTSMPSV
jgi:hypothetical protein